MSGGVAARRIAPGRATLAVLALLALLAPGASATLEGGRGKIGEWEVAWRYSESGGFRSRFRDVCDSSVAFPIAWRRLTDSRGDRLAFFDADGKLESEFVLERGEEAVASEDGSAILAWSANPNGGELHRFRFFDRGEALPAWEAYASGAPVLLAPDGSVLVIASRGRKLDRLRRMRPEAGGRLQVVGAGGEIRGELPIFPIFSRFTGNLRRISFLHNEELIVLGRDGLLDWTKSVPVDDLSFRNGIPQLATGGERIVVCGTGSASARMGGALHPPRRGTILALDDQGRLLWKLRQPEDEELWFQISVALSPDGSVLASCHSPPGDLVVRSYDGATGELRWARTVRRRSGFRSLSVAEGGELILLAQCGARTNVVAWDREGRVVWEGLVPFGSESAELAPGQLLVADRWILRLKLGTGES